MSHSDDTFGQIIWYRSAAYYISVE